MTAVSLSATRRPSDDERRERILEAAERAFAAHGFHAATMQHVAEAAGMSAGNLYRTFPSKEAIVEGLCARDQQERVTNFVNAAEAESVFAAFSQGLREHIALRSRRKATLIVEIWAEAAHNPAIAAMSLAIDAEILRQIERMIDMAKQRGEAAAFVELGPSRPLHLHLCRRPPEATGLRAGLRRSGGSRTGVRAVQRFMQWGLRSIRNGGFVMSRLLGALVLVVAIFGGAWGYAALRPCARLVIAARALGLPVGDPVCAAGVVNAAQPPAEPAPPAVTVATLARREFIDRHFVSGTLVARNEAEVAARIDGLSIVEIDSEDGDRVKAGQVLARLDRTQLDALLAQNDASAKRADASIEQARSLIAQAQAQATWTSDDYERARRLGDGVMSVSTIQQRETALKTAQAQLAAAKNALSVAEADRKSRDAERQELEVRISRAEVKAPVSGVVSRRSAKLGASASSAGEPLFRIIEDGAIDLEADVPEQSLARFAVGMPATIRLPGVAAPVSGRVRLISEEVDKASRTGKVRIELDDVSHARIGAFASGEVELARRDGVGAPAASLLRDGDTARLLVVRDGRVEERRVTPGIVEGDAVEIKDGAVEGESVVARAGAFLRPGDRVRAIPAPAAAGG